MKCGNCKRDGVSVAEVRECYATRYGVAVADVPTLIYVEPVEAPAPATEGMYRKDGTIYKVQVAVHGSGLPYAKRLVVDEVPCETCSHQFSTDCPACNGSSGSYRTYFEYAPGAIRQLDQSHRLTLEQAKEFGALYGTCCVCGRTLTNETSIEAGIGPTCAGRLA